MQHQWVKQPSFKNDVSYKCDLCKLNFFGENPPEFGCFGSGKEKRKQTDLVQDFGFPDAPKQLKIGEKKIMEDEMESKSKLIAEKIASEISLYLSAIREPTIVFTRSFLFAVNNLSLPMEPIFFDNEGKLDECIRKIREEIPEIKVMEWK